MKYVQGSILSRLLTKLKGPRHPELQWWVYPTTPALLCPRLANWLLLKNLHYYFSTTHYRSGPICTLKNLHYYFSTTHYLLAWSAHSNSESITLSDCIQTQNVPRYTCLADPFLDIQLPYPVLKHRTSESPSQFSLWHAMHLSDTITY